MNQKSTSSYKLALPEEILLQVEKPERYLGNELNVTEERIPGASGFILHGQTWITSCARKRFRSLRWNHRIP